MSGTTSNDASQQPDDAHPEPDQEAVTLQRERRRSCIVMIIMAWLGMGVVLVLIVLFVRHRVNRDADDIATFMSSRFGMELPEGFQPYSMNRFMGVNLITYWDQNHLREDGRTYNVLAVYSEDDWRGKSLAEVETMVLKQIEDRLMDNEFTTEAQSSSSVATPAGVEVTIHRFSGRHAMDDQVVAATSCFRFMQGPDGPVQLQTMGLDETFPVEQQIAILASFVAK